MRGTVFPAAILPFLALLLGGCGERPGADPFRGNGEIIAFGGGDGGPSAACVTCHGLKGEGDGQLAPRLAGLDAGYLQRQLDDYANGRREHAAMRRVVRRLTLDDRARVAGYYAGLTPPAPPVRERSADDVGARLYADGDPTRGLAACATCHGAAGEGRGGGNPPLGQQPPAYLEDQLVAWRTARRNNDPLGEMRKISRRLAPAEVRAVADYAAALPGVRRP
ncbi:MAG: c-type cytochrome [Pseudomonadota bacterium]